MIITDINNICLTHNKQYDIIGSMAYKDMEKLTCDATPSGVCERWLPRKRGMCGDCKHAERKLCEEMHSTVGGGIRFNYIRTALDVAAAETKISTGKDGKDVILTISQGIYYPHTE